MKQREIATLPGMPQSTVSVLKNFQRDYFSIECLMEFLTALKQAVAITIRPHAGKRKSAHISVLPVHYR